MKANGIGNVSIESIVVHSPLRNDLSGTVPATYHQYQYDILHNVTFKK
jgi:hypothetical protein